MPEISDRRRAPEAVAAAKCLQVLEYSSEQEALVYLQVKLSDLPGSREDFRVYRVRFDDWFSPPMYRTGDRAVQNIRRAHGGVGVMIVERGGERTEIPQRKYVCVRPGDTIIWTLRLAD